MKDDRSPATRFSLAVFLVLTFGCFWLATPLASVSFLLPALVASFAPAVVAILLTTLTAGSSGARALVSKLGKWRVGWVWYAAALGIPIGVSLLARATSALFGAASTVLASSLSAALPVVFVLAAGEELGWRGFALPRLLTRLPALPVSLLLGIIHAAYHLPLWIAPGFPTPAYSFASFVVTSLAFGIMWTWLYQHTAGSVLITTMFHGAVNAAGNVFFAGIEPSHLSWLMPLGFGAVALVVLIVNGPGLAQRPATRCEGEPA